MILNKDIKSSIEIETNKTQKEAPWGPLQRLTELYVPPFNLEPQIVEQLPVNGAPDIGRSLRPLGTVSAEITSNAKAGSRTVLSIPNVNFAPDSGFP